MLIKSPDPNVVLEQTRTEKQTIALPRDLDSFIRRYRKALGLPSFNSTLIRMLADWLERENLDEFLIGYSTPAGNHGHYRLKAESRKAARERFHLIHGQSITINFIEQI